MSMETNFTVTASWFRQETMFDPTQTNHFKLLFTERDHYELIGWLDQDHSGLQRLSSPVDTYGMWADGSSGKVNLEPCVTGYFFGSLSDARNLAAVTATKFQQVAVQLTSSEGETLYDRQFVYPVVVGGEIEILNRLSELEIPGAMIVGQQLVVNASLSDHLRVLNQVRSVLGHPDSIQHVRVEHCRPTDSNED